MGRFARADEAAGAAKQLATKSYFCVITEVGMLEADDDGGWTVLHTVQLGAMLSTA